MKKFLKICTKEAEKYSPEVIGKQRIALYKQVIEKINQAYLINFLIKNK